MQLPKGKNDKNEEWMLNSQEAVNIHLPIFAFVGQLTRFAVRAYYKSEKKSLFKNIEAEESGYLYTKYKQKKIKKTRAKHASEMEQGS